MLNFYLIIGAVVFLVAYWKYQDRQTKLDLQREQQAFELTKLQAQIASDPARYNVKIVPTEVRQ